MSWGYLSWGGICHGGYSSGGYLSGGFYPGGFCPGGICPRTLNSIYSSVCSFVLSIFSAYMCKVFRQLSVT